MPISLTGCHEYIFHIQTGANHILVKGEFTLDENDIRITMSSQCNDMFLTNGCFAFVSRVLKFFDSVAKMPNRHLRGTDLILPTKWHKKRCSGSDPF